MVVTWPNPPHDPIFSSITSTELRKITFFVWYMHKWKIFSQRMGAWGLIDKQLCELVDRLCFMGYRHTLEAELRLAEIEGKPGEYDFTGFLPEFRAKGVVTVVHGDQLLHSSAHHR